MMNSFIEMLELPNFGLMTTFTVRLLNYMPHVPSRLTCLLAFAPYVPYMPSRLTCLTHSPYLCALCGKTFLG